MNWWLKNESVRHAHGLVGLRRWPKRRTTQVRPQRDWNQISSVVIWSPSLVTPSPAPSTFHLVCCLPLASHLVVCSATATDIIRPDSRSLATDRTTVWSHDGRTTAWKLQFSLAKHLDKPEPKSWMSVSFLFLRSWNSLRKTNYLNTQFLLSFHLRLLFDEPRFQSWNGPGHRASSPDASLNFAKLVLGSLETFNLRHIFF